MSAMNTYKVFIQFKNGKSLDFVIETESNLKNTFNNVLDEPHIIIGDYVIAAQEILWSRIEGENGEHSEEL